MSRCIAADPVCSSTTAASVAVTGTSKTANIAVDPNCRTVVGGDQTVTPEPSN